MEEKPTQKRFSPEVRARAVRMVQDHLGDHPSEWAAICSIASKIGCNADTLRNWIRQGQHDKGQHPGAALHSRTADAAHGLGGGNPGKNSKNNNQRQSTPLSTRQSKSDI